MTEPLDELEQFAVRQLQSQLHYVKRCTTCVESKPVTLFPGYGAECCIDCAARLCPNCGYALEGAMTVCRSCHRRRRSVA